MTKSKEVIQARPRMLIESPAGKFYAIGYDDAWTLLREQGDKGALPARSRFDGWERV